MPSEVFLLCSAPSAWLGRLSTELSLFGLDFGNVSHTETDFDFLSAIDVDTSDDEETQEPSASSRDFP